MIPVDQGTERNMKHVDMGGNDLSAVHSLSMSLFLNLRLSIKWVKEAEF